MPPGKRDEKEKQIDKIIRKMEHYKISELLNNYCERKNKCYRFLKASRRNKKLAFRNNASSRSRILKVNNTLIDSAKDLDIMYNFKTFWYFTKFSFHQEWNEVWLLVIDIVYASCLTSCRTT